MRPKSNIFRRRKCRVSLNPLPHHHLEFISHVFAPFYEFCCSGANLARILGGGGFQSSGLRSGWRSLEIF